MGESVENSTSFYDLLPELRHETNNQLQDNSNQASFYESLVNGFYSCFGLVKRHDWAADTVVIFSYEEKVRMHLALLEAFDSSSPYYKEILEHFIQILETRVSQGSEYPIGKYRKQLENLKKREGNQSDKSSHNTTESYSELPSLLPELPSLLSSGLYETSAFLTNWNHCRFLFLYIKSEIEASLNALKDIKLDNMVSQINPYTSAMGIVYYGPSFLYNTGKSLYHRIVDGDFHYFNINRGKLFNDFRWIIIDALLFFSCYGMLGAFFTLMGYGFGSANCFTNASNKLAVTQNLLECVQDKINRESQQKIKALTDIQKIKALTDIQTAINNQYKYHNIDQKRQTLLSEMVFAGSFFGLFHFVLAPVVSATLMLVSSTYLYYHNHYYLPQLKVQTHHDPLGLLYDKLITYTEAEIERLEKSLENIAILNGLATNNVYLSETSGNNDEISTQNNNINKNDYENQNENITTNQIDKSKSGTAVYLFAYKSKTEEKLKKYQEAYQKLIAWAKSEERNPEELKNAMKMVEDASKMHRRENSVLFAPKSRSSLETTVKPFLAQWNNNKNTTKDQEQSIKTQITEFTESRTKKIFYNYLQKISGSCCNYFTN